MYHAVGPVERSRGQAASYEIDPSFRHEDLPVEEGLAPCDVHEDGSPNRSVYISVYLALERIPLDAILRLHLVTRDGRVLGIDPSETCPEDTAGLHLYQEIAPVHRLVVSTLGPREFYSLIVGTPASLLTLPAVWSAELQLGELVGNTEYGTVGNLPSANIDHVRQSSVALRTKTVHTKMVDLVSSASFPYRTLRMGLFVGNTARLMCFPMPSQEELRHDQHRCWRSADM